MGGEFAKKTCPRCGEALYADMQVCYGCLYDFSRKDNGPSEVVSPPAPAVEPVLEPDGPAPSAEPARPPEPGRPDVRAGGEEDFTTVLAEEVAGAAPHCVLVRSSGLDVLLPIGPEGISVGRGSGNQVVIHDKAVSRRHLRLSPTSRGVEATDLGATNPARFRGARVSGSVLVPWGEPVQVGEVTFFARE